MRRCTVTAAPVDKFDLDFSRRASRQPSKTAKNAPYANTSAKSFLPERIQKKCKSPKPAIR